MAPSTRSNPPEGNGSNLDYVASQLAAIAARLDSLVALKDDLAAIKAAWMDNTEPWDEPKDPLTNLVKEEVSSDSSSDIDEVSEHVLVDNLDFVMESVAVHGADWVKADPDVIGEKLKLNEKNFVSMELPDGVLPKKETSVDNFAPGNMASFSGGFRYGSAFGGQAYGGDKNRRYNSISSFLWYYSSFSPGKLILIVLVSWCQHTIPVQMYSIWKVLLSSKDLMEQLQILMGIRPDPLLISVQHLPVEEAFMKITIIAVPISPSCDLRASRFSGREVLIHTCSRVNPAHGYTGSK